MAQRYRKDERVSLALILFCNKELFLAESVVSAE
jgi:hypothetical protein